MPKSLLQTLWRTRKGRPKAAFFIMVTTNYFLAVAKRLLISSQLTVFHQAAR